MSKIQYVPANESGTDFICGDIHGCYEKLETALADVGFNKDTDRLFVLGDLVDRGPNSELCLEYLDKPWFYSIMGNHELLVCEGAKEIFSGQHGRWGTVWMGNGGLWGIGDNQLLDECQDRFRRLPLAIQLELPGGEQIGLVHAEFDIDVVPDWPALTTYLETLETDRFEFDESDPVVMMMVWTREKRKKAQYIFNRPEDRIQQPIVGIDHIFHGHDIVDEVVTVGNCTYIDTGSFLNSGWITVVNPQDYV